MTQSSSRRLVLSVAVALLGAPSAFAQSFTGQIVGMVTDASGAAIPRAEVTITHLQTNRKVSTLANDRGRYVSVPLDVGDYRVEAAMDGFKRAVKTGITVRIQDTVVVDFALEIGGLSEQVEVTAEVGRLETTTSSLGKVVDNRRIRDLPLNTRNVYSLVFLTPGVAGSVATDYSGLNYSVNGARPKTMDTIIDGVTASHSTVTGSAGISVFPSVDAIQEFKVLGANYAAEFGRSTGNVLNVVFKSGTNQFHGTAYEFLRDSAFDSNNFFAKRRGQELGSFGRNQFGGYVGGPVRRDRTFFMASYEGLRQRSFSSTTTTVPTLLERQGDFSRTFAPSGQLVTIFNPFTTRPNPAGSGFIRDPFPGNRIPAGMMDPVALKVMAYYPLPNQPGDAVTGRNNYFQSGTLRRDINNFDVRLDEHISSRQKLFVRYSKRDTLDTPPPLFPDEIAIAEGRVNEENHSHNFVTDYTNALSPSSIMTLRLGFARTLFVFANQGLGFVPSSLGLPASIDRTVDRQMFPRFGATGYVNLGGNDHRYNAFNTYSLVGSFLKIRDKHSAKVGFDARLFRVNVWEARSSGTFGFAPGFTQGPDPNRASATAGNSIASLLLGTGTNNNVLIQGWKNVASESLYLAGYAQDDWRVSRKLTFNLGLRYDVEAPRTERYDRMNYFDPDARSPLAGRVAGFPDLEGGLVFMGVDGVSRRQFKWDTNNVAPRLGLAYQIDARTVLRAGYGHVFGISPHSANGTVGPFGFRVEYPWVTTLDGITPYNLLRDPYPQGFREPPGSTEGLLTQTGANLQAVLRDTPTPWSRQFNVNLQRELPWGTFLEVAYVGTRGYNLSTAVEGGRSLNQLDPSLMSLGSRLNELVPNPFLGIVNNGVLVAPRVSRAQLLRPYPQFTEIVPMYMAGARSFYNALQVSFGKRLSHGLLFEGSYTWSKAIEDGQSHQNSYDIRASRSLATYDIPHRFVVSYLWELPFGHGRRFGTGWSGLLNAVLGGWQINGITTIQSGTPLSLTASNTAGIFNAVTRPNWTGNPATLDGPAEDRLSRFFNTSQFSQPAPFTFGNMGPTSSELRSHGVNNTDLSIFKTFRPRPNLALQLRVEALNAFNRVQFAAPELSVTSTSFGVVSAQANEPRQLQFGVKLLW
jgi:hypothetical protein